MDPLAHRLAAPSGPGAADDVPSHADLEEQRHHDQPAAAQDELLDGFSTAERHTFETLLRRLADIPPP
ncbi:hypothetical protein [Micromonospora sp. DT233]|uniref:hypothetical protein n=1 Tax=Micromonospora sp. DT233 TaxID=3393432 RepID=UPI003CFB9E59